MSHILLIKLCNYTLSSILNTLDTYLHFKIFESVKRNITRYIHLLISMHVWYNDLDIGIDFECTYNYIYSISLFFQVTMKLKVADNGNVVAIRQQEVSADVNFDNRSWLSNNTDSRSYSYNSRHNHSQFNSNFNFYDSRDSTDFLRSSGARIDAFNRDSNTNTICNRQYRINAENNGLFLNSLNNQQTTNLEGSTNNTFSTRESFLGEFPT